ncbi:H/ACA ribonucleoprotein complex non-core subunit NAF1 [Phytophthora nicotianae]|uniref:H/ACA ribonucleoprotein complex subunit n=1 Tax=Phytophthora nicotianae TaxID=4792 RepID=A0A0W8CYY5_PHYNI|nr:H/ACA ribonucleoprotein complex non-core subunit NAF1 [Phytophthora nicotianae]
MDAQQSSAPVSDLAVAAQYADEELHSVTAQFANSATVSEAPKAPMVAVTDKVDDSDSDSDSSDDEAPVEKKGEKNLENGAVEEPVKKEATGESSGEDSDAEGEEPAKLRAEIEAAMEKEENKTGGPLTTEHEVASAPVREPKVELTADCPIAQCGSILNVSVPGLMLTIKSNPNTKPLDEGSVLCLEDRTVIGCVDEVFGPVLMPMYLIRFENAAKMPEKAMVNTAVYYATEHTTYIVPEEIKDKGTDASNIFDEEADETEFSDDEAEAAAKRGNRKRNRAFYNGQQQGQQPRGPYDQRRY